MSSSPTRLILPVFVSAILFSSGAEVLAQTRSRTPSRPTVRRAQPTPAPARPQNDAYAPEPGYQPYAAEPSYPSSDAAVTNREQRRTPDNIWQAHAGRVAVTAELGYGYAKADLKAVNVGKIGEAERSRFTFNFGGEYGVTRNIAVRARSSYGSITNDNKITSIGAQSSTDKASGLGDIELGGKVLYPVQSFLVSGDLGLSFSFGDQKTAETGREGNRYSGGMALNPTIGGAVYLGRAGFLGGLISYRFKFERTSALPSGATAKLTGGNEIIPQFFYEYQQQDFFISPSISYIVTDDLKSNVNGPTSTIVTDSVLALAIKGGFYIRPELRLAATYTLRSIPENSASLRPASSYFDHDFLASARMEF